MSQQTLNFIGQSGYYFFFGWCEDRNDPMKIGRIRVRIAGLHSSDKTTLPTESLPWCQVILPVNTNDSTMHDIQNGTAVTGFFLDGEDMQMPMINGHLPGLIDPSQPHYSGRTDKTLSSYADGRKNKERVILAGGKVQQPADSSAPQYPFNHVLETEAGHIIEYDDTPGNERLCVQHKTGSFVEIDSGGNTTIRNKNSYIVNSENSYELCQNKIVQVNQNLDITVNGNANITVNGNAVETISGKKSITAGQVSITASSIKLN